MSLWAGIVQAYRTPQAEAAKVRSAERRRRLEEADLLGPTGSVGDAPAGTSEKAEAVETFPTAPGGINDLALPRQLTRIHRPLPSPATTPQLYARPGREPGYRPNPSAGPVGAGTVKSLVMTTTPLRNP